MTELESSLISERVITGMRAAESRGRHLGQPGTLQRVINEIEALAAQASPGGARLAVLQHGYKFCSVVGEILADMATGDGTTRHDIGFLQLDRRDTRILEPAG